MGRMKSLLGVLVAVLLLVAGAGIAGAQQPKLVIDNSHGQIVDLSGTGGLADSLYKKGWNVVYVGPGESIEAALANCSLLVVPQPTVKFEEVAAVQTYVQNGGGLWVLYDADAPSYLNDLPAAFGVTFNAGVVTDYDSWADSWIDQLLVSTPTDPSDPASSHPLFVGVTAFSYYRGVSLNPGSLPVVVTASTIARVDGVLQSEPPLFAAAEVGCGHVVFIGDTTPLEASTYPLLDAETKQLLDNIVTWLETPTSTCSPVVPTTKEVTINIIRPWNRHNTISLNARGFIRVAIMSDANFNAADVDPKSVVFAGASPVCWKLQKVNRDHQKDLVLVFWIADLVKDSDNENGLTCDSTTVELTGKTNDGTPIHGSDSVQIEPTGKCKKPPEHENCGGKKRK